MDAREQRKAAKQFSADWNGKGDEKQDTQRFWIEETAQAILDARALYPDSSLADMYDPDTDWLYPELKKAHQQNDIAVMTAYGWKPGDAAFSSEAACVAELMKMYQQLTQAEKK